jgi:phosphoenolpyruvate-protein kinase (PTS system EI component)
VPNEKNSASFAIASATRQARGISIIVPTRWAIALPVLASTSEAIARTRSASSVNSFTMPTRGIITSGRTSIAYLVGTMIEIPRACLVAEAIAKEAEFFSFGTNDLTQMTYGFSRDDIGKFLPDYLNRRILPFDPFQSIDQEGVGKLVALSVEEGRKGRPALKVGICGEHGGDPASVEFFHRSGLDYVSCSPYRVPVARLAAAHAVLAEEGGGGSGTA